MIAHPIKHDIDWTTAPEGTTHFIFSDVQSILSGFYTQRGVKMFFMDQDYAFRTDDNYGAMIRYIRAPEPEPEGSGWSGDGLPPVGTVCEWKLKQEFQYVAAEVLFVSDKSIVLRRKDGFEWQEVPSRCCFRPIRTQEQIEAEERESVIAEIEEILTGYSYRKCAELAYDYFYRKQPKEDA